MPKLTTAQQNVIDRMKAGETLSRTANGGHRLSHETIHWKTAYRLGQLGYISIEPFPSLKYTLTDKGKI